MQRVAATVGRGRTAQRSASPGRARARKVAGSLGVPVGKDSVVSVVLTRIKEALLRKTLRPGDYLPSETELTKTFGVSKSSVREAVKMLQAMGVVEVRHGQGTRVRHASRPGHHQPVGVPAHHGGRLPRRSGGAAPDVRAGVLGHGDGAGDGRGPRPDPPGLGAAGTIRPVGIADGGRRHCLSPRHPPGHQEPPRHPASARPSFSSSDPPSASP